MWFWFRQEAFWYCKMIQFILIGVNKPALIKNSTLDGQETRVLEKILLSEREQALHIFYMFLYSLLVNEVSQSSWDIKILRSLFTDLFVGEIYN